MKRSLLSIPALLLASALNSVAQPSVQQPIFVNGMPELAPPETKLTTTIDLGEPNPLALYLPSPPISINPGTTLTLRPDSATWSNVTNVQWFKNGEPIGETSANLVIPATTSDDNGSYRATFTSDGEAAGTVPAHIIVSHGLNHPLVNISTRVTISSASPRAIVGFVVPEKISSDYLPKTFLIRGIGPSLVDYGVTDPLPDPLIQVFDAEGNDVTPAWAFAQIVYDDGTTPESHYYTSVAAAAQAVGAFPIPVPGPENPPIAEFAELAAFAPGSYTVVLSSDGGQSGEALIEVYNITP